MQAAHHSNKMFDSFSTTIIDDIIYFAMVLRGAFWARFDLKHYMMGGREGTGQMGKMIFYFYLSNYERRYELYIKRLHSCRISWSGTRHLQYEVIGFWNIDLRARSGFVKWLYNGEKEPFLLRWTPSHWSRYGRAVIPNNHIIILNNEGSRCSSRQTSRSMSFNPSVPFAPYAERFWKYIFEKKKSILISAMLVKLQLWDANR